MAKTTILLLLLISIVADQANAAAEKKLSPDAEKSENSIVEGVLKITDAIGSTTPPAKKVETTRAVAKNLETLNSILDKAKASGDEKKIADLDFSVQIAVSLITRAPPAKRLEVMEDSFNSLAAPSPLDCPEVDKPYCETESKIQKAYEGVMAAAPAKERVEVRAAVLKKPVHTATTTINKAYADGDEKKIAQVLAAYSKAADEVIAAAPADKLNVMEKTFADAGKN